MGTDIHIVAEVKRDGEWRLSDIKVPCNRDYDTFAILANIRNGFGFAGVKTGEPLTPISLPRGLPKDISEELKGKMNLPGDNDCWLGDHSYSYITLKEMLEYDYNGLRIECGMVTHATAEAFRKEGKLPEEWCGWTSMKGYEKMEWKRPLKEAAYLFGEIVVSLIPLGEPENVRIVFGFDS
jgi:hypothetical protein